MTVMGLFTTDSLYTRNGENIALHQLQSTIFLTKRWFSKKIHKFLWSKNNKF